MAENTHAQNELDAADSAHEGAPRLSGRAMVAAARREVRLADRAARRQTSDGRRRLRPVRALGTVAAVGALIAGVAIPAYAATQGGGDTVAQMGVHQQATGDAQTYEAGDAEAPGLASVDYAATTADEIEQKKAEEAALERARQQQEQAAAAAAHTEAAGAPAAAAPAPVSSGSGVFPLPGGYTVGDGLGARRGHQGQDLLAATGTPIYAVHDCAVTSAGYSGAFGNLVVLNCNVDGSSVQIHNAHMSSIAVGVGQTVSAGEVIGYVGSTGRSTAPHLHIEIRVNGALVEPMAYL